MDTMWLAMPYDAHEIMNLSKSFFFPPFRGSAWLLRNPLGFPYLYNGECIRFRSISFFKKVSIVVVVVACGSWGETWSKGVFRHKVE